MTLVLAQRVLSRPFPGRIIIIPMTDYIPVQPPPPEFIVPKKRSLFVRFMHLVGEVLQTILVAGLLFLAVNLVTARIRVEGNSMEPSLHDGEFVVVNRLAYRWSLPDRGDIIVFNFPLDPQRRFIKRIIGLPGDTVSAHSNHIYVNGIALSEPYVAAAPLYTGQWVVGEDAWNIAMPDVTPGQYKIRVTGTQQCYNCRGPFFDSSGTATDESDGWFTIR